MLRLAVILTLLPSIVYAQDYKDSATSTWFKSLSSPYINNCCDQADCHPTASDFRLDPLVGDEPRRGHWWALSNRTHTWAEIEDDKMTGQISIFKDGVLCEGTPYSSDVPNVYCFTPPPLGF